MTGDVESFMLYKEMNQVGAEGQKDTLEDATEELAAVGLEDLTS